MAWKKEVMSAAHPCTIFKCEYPPGLYFWDTLWIVSCWKTPSRFILSDKNSWYKVIAPMSKWNRRKNNMQSHGKGNFRFCFDLTVNFLVILWHHHICDVLSAAQMSGKFNQSWCCHQFCFIWNWRSTSKYF